MGAPKAAATRNSALWPLAVLRHAMAFQKSPTYMRGTSEPNDRGFLCSSSDDGFHGDAPWAQSLFSPSTLFLSTLSPR